MLNILIDMPVHAPHLRKLEQLPGIQVSLVEHPEERKRILPQALIEGCDMLLCTFPPENHQQMAGLKMIQISSAGYSQLIGQQFEDRNIQACNALGVFDVPIGEWNMAMMINLARDFKGLLRNQDQKVWDRDARYQKEISGSVVGIWGYGGIGRETSRLAKALHMKVHVLSRSGVNERKNVYHVPGTGDPAGTLPDRVFLYEEKEEFLKSLDFLIMAIPQTPGTEGIVGEAELKLLKPQAYLLNPARGVLIQEQALLRALRENWIAGAALDTHYYYPLPPDHPLWSMPNVILTPHISGSSASTNFLERVWDIFVQNVERYINKEPLLNELTPSQLKGN